VSSSGSDYDWPSSVDLRPRPAGVHEPMFGYGSALLYRHPRTESDQHASGQRIDDSTDRPAKQMPCTRHHHAVRREPGEREQAEQEAEQQKDDKRTAAVRSELRQHADEERRHLRVRKVVHDTLTKGASRGQPRLRERSRDLALSAEPCRAQRLDAEEQKV
jgi:hypothetical protein